MRFSFGDVELDTDRFLLERGGEPVHVQPQVFDVLWHLLRNRDRVVPKTELLDAVWGDRFVSESTLTSRIKVAARASATTASCSGHQDRARPGLPLGGRRRGPWTSAAAAAGAARATRSPRRLEQRIRFCTCPDGVRVAYATVGRARRSCARLTGSPTSTTSGRVRSGGTGWRGSRGAGCSSATTSAAVASPIPTPQDISFESFVRDLETVVDELGLERFPLMGVSQGGPVAIEYAVRHPERVSRLVLVGTFVKGRMVRAATPGGAPRGRAAERADPHRAGDATTRRSASSSPPPSWRTRLLSCGATSPC